MTLKQILLLTSTFLLVLLIAAYFSLRPIVSEYLFNAVTATAAKNNIGIEFTEPTAGILGIKAKELNVLKSVGVGRITFPVKNVSLQPSYLSLLQLKPEVAGKFNFLSGSGSVLLNVSSSHPKINSLQLVDADLTKQPQVRILKINAGTIGINIKNLPLTSSRSKLSYENLAIQIKDLKKNTTTFIPRLNQQLPAFVVKELLLESRTTDRKILIPTLRLDSTLIKLDLVAELTNTAKPKIMNLKANVNLTDGGADILSPYINLFSSGQMPADTRKFSMEFQKYVSGIPQFRFEALEVGTEPTL